MDLGWSVGALEIGRRIGVVEDGGAWFVGSQHRSERAGRGGQPVRLALGGLGTWLVYVDGDRAVVAVTPTNGATTTMR